jgi:ParB-like chromosome segregation protein Spo0J
MSTKQIKRIPLDKLLAHPANPNVMSDADFAKLCAHIAKTANYESIIVRTHPDTEGSFEIINGHHRTKALAHLGYDHADCVIWDVDNEGVLMLLATLNQLRGRDELSKKSQLIKSLTTRFSTEELSKILPETTKSIKRLKDVTAKIEMTDIKAKAMLNSVVYFLNDDQKQIVENAIDTALKDIDKGTLGQRKATAIVEIATRFLENKTSTD